MLHMSTSFKRCGRGGGGDGGGPTCVLGQAGAVAVALGGRDAVRPHGAPIGGQGSRRGRRLALARAAEGPLAGVAIPRAVRRLHAFPGDRI